MRLLFILPLIMLINLQLKGQHKCVYENLSEIKVALIDCFGKEWYQTFESSSKNKIYLNVIVDIDGNILEIPEHKIYQGISEQDYKKFSKYFVKKHKLCVYNPESELSFEKYIEMHKGKLSYKIIFSPYILKEANIK